MPFRSRAGGVSPCYATHLTTWRLRGLRSPLRYRLLYLYRFISERVRCNLAAFAKMGDEAAHDPHSCKSGYRRIMPVVECHYGRALGLRPPLSVRYSLLQSARLF